ncbi:hypothetical protein SDC9_82245 [bioreactor metagenome]|uniref:Uncharacterized protein n=1 Tax=bioreactor metagenome TaxID=1076179 RepID=A0A644Z4D3_9ZZZZ
MSAALGKRRGDLTVGLVGVMRKQARLNVAAGLAARLRRVPELVELALAVEEVLQIIVRNCAEQLNDRQIVLYPGILLRGGRKHVRMQQPGQHVFAAHIDRRNRAAVVERNGFEPNLIHRQTEELGNALLRADWQVAEPNRLDRRMVEQKLGDDARGVCEIDEPGVRRIARDRFGDDLDLRNRP